MLENMVSELTMVKGPIPDQTDIMYDLREDMDEIKKCLTSIEEQLHVVLTLLKPS